MAYHDQITAEGHQAYRANRTVEATLLFRRAASVALELGDRAAWFKNIVWAADATYLKGDMQTSLALFLEARQSEPEDAPQFEAWIARKKIFSITRLTHPERARLQQLLTDLRSYSTTHCVPTSDLSRLEGELFQSCGDWSTALAHYETAWQDYDGHGFLKCSHAYQAAHCCLRLGRFAACRDWIAAGVGCGEEGWAANHYGSTELTLHLALAEGQPFTILLSNLRTYIDRTTNIQRDEVASDARELTTRVHLLDLHAGDPAADFHPSRAELRRPFGNRQHVFYRYKAHLLYLDFRLACLRYAANVPAVDDLYYYQPQQVQVAAHLTPTDPEQFQRRLHKARAAVRSALRYARHLDNLLECGYRQREIQARSERIEEIARLIQSNLTD